MSFLDSLLGGAMGGDAGASGEPQASENMLGTALSSLLHQNGGVQGLMEKFSHGGLGEVFSSWVGLGQNQSIDAGQIQAILGSEQVQGLAAKLGIDPAMASTFLASYLPKIIDKLTPTGAVEPGAGGEAQTQQGLEALLPALMRNMGGES